MRKTILWALAALAVSACGQKKTTIDPFDQLTSMVDSAAHKADTVPLPVVEEIKPIEADELFDDFIFNYAQDHELQLQRTKFPLPYYKEDSPLKIEKAFWKHDDLFSKENAYTLLFDNEEQMDLVGDTTLMSVQVEWIYLKTRTIKKYYFEKLKGVWMLEAINLRKMATDEPADFIAFYTRFATDSLFQQKHIAPRLQFVTIDPDDEFSILETTLDAGQWTAFSPQLPKERLSNIDYGQHISPQSHTRILKINGIGNGYSNLFYFRRQGESWELYRYEDTSM
ncbi:MAG: DUF4348 domain-containing protein [Mediterranea sp.]|nr:DUF4348 domain-containing protein [Mediterranea sp.]